MPVTTTPRLGIARWDSGTDPFLRDDLDDSFVALEAKVGIFLQGVILSRPSAADVVRGFYLATNENAPQGVLYYSDGTTWVALNAFANPVAQVPGDSITQGTAITYARSDHKHSLPSWGLVGELAQVGTVAAVGSVDKFARIDHVHVLASNSVTAGKIATGGVSATAQIADGIITTAKIAANQITSPLLSVDQRQQPGAIVMWPAATAPSGWLLCDGSSVSTTTYAGIFAITGYSYGGSGANFNLPNLMGRVPVGAGAGAGLTARTVGQSGGEETHLLTLAESPSHSHTVNSHSHGGVTGNTSVDHTHTYSSTSGAQSVDHTHTYSGTSAGQSGGHTHGYSTDTGSDIGDHYHLPGVVGEFIVSGSNGNSPASLTEGGGGRLISQVGNTYYENTTHYHSLSGTTGAQSNDHTHGYSGTTAGVSASHTHSVSGTTAGQSVTHTHTVSAEAPGTNTAGGGGTHNVMQPYAVVSFIIKT